MIWIRPILPSEIKSFFHLFQLQIWTLVCEGHNSGWVQVCWSGLTCNLEQFRWSRKIVLSHLCWWQTLNQELWKPEFLTTFLPFHCHLWSTQPVKCKEWNDRNSCRKQRTNLVSKPDHHCFHCSVALKIRHWGNLSQPEVHQLYSVVFLTGPPKKWLSVRLHVKCQNFLRVWDLVIFRADQLKKPPCTILCLHTRWFE